MYSLMRLANDRLLQAKPSVRSSNNEFSPDRAKLRITLISLRHIHIHF